MHAVCACAQCTQLQVEVRPPGPGVAPGDWLAPGLRFLFPHVVLRVLVLQTLWTSLCDGDGVADLRDARGPQHREEDLGELSAERVRTVRVHTSAWECPSLTAD